jgi:hypothetical protein
LSLHSLISCVVLIKLSSKIDHRLPEIIYSTVQAGSLSCTYQVSLSQACCVWPRVHQQTPCPCWLLSLNGLSSHSTACAIRTIPSVAGTLTSTPTRHLQPCAVSPFRHVPPSQQANPMVVGSSAGHIRSAPGGAGSLGQGTASQL